MDENNETRTKTQRRVSAAVAIVVAAMVASTMAAVALESPTVELDPSLPGDTGALLGSLPEHALYDLHDAHVAEIVALADEITDPTERLLAQTELAMRHQALVTGITLSYPPGPLSASPSQAIIAWMAGSSFSLTPSVGTDLAMLDSLPTDQADTLARLVDAHAAVENAVLAGQPGAVAAARIVLTQALLDVSQAWPVEDKTIPASNHCTVIDNPPAFYFEFGGGGCDTPVGGQTCLDIDYSFVFDEGGNDVYCNNAGGSGHDRTGSSFAAALLVNLNGTDQYIGGDYGRTWGINGGARDGSSGFLYDRAGNDVYKAGKMGVSQHSSANGGATDDGSFGALIDEAGNDRYEGGWDASQGGGSLAGRGLLVDGGGSNVFTGIGGGQSHGAVNGGGIRGGHGALYAYGNGDDHFNGGSGGINGGAMECQSTGFLYSQGGDDRFVARHIGVNGGGAGASGYLYTGTGDDHYAGLVTMSTASNGAGEPRSCSLTPGVSLPGFGHLTDAAGCDWYKDAYGQGFDLTLIPKSNAGLPSYGEQIDVPDQACLSPKSIELTAYGSCVLLHIGDVECWGHNGFGQGTDRANQDVMALGGGTWHLCFVLQGGSDDGNVECQGQSGFGKTNPYLGGDAIDVDAGLSHTCALLQDGNAKCWGQQAFGASKDYTDGDAIDVSTGSWHSCFLRSNGNVKCNGYNLYGAAVDYNGADAVKVSAGSAHNCVVTTSGSVECWGYNNRGQSDPYPTLSATDVAVDVAAGRGHSCALLADGNAVCWGSDSSDQLEGYQGLDAVEIDAGHDHTCVRTLTHEVKCWGLNNNGQSNPWP